MKIINKERPIPVWAGLQIWCDYCPAVYELEASDSFGVLESDSIRDYRNEFASKCPICGMRTEFPKPLPRDVRSAPYDKHNPSAWVDNPHNSRSQRAAWKNIF